MKKTDIYTEPKDSEYVEKMAKAIKAQGPYMHPMGTKQAASTLKLMSMPVDEPFISTINPIAAHPDEVKRKVTYEEFMTYEKMRREVKNATGDSFDENPGPREGRKNAAVDAYLNTKPDPLGHFQRLMHTLKEEPKPLEKPKEESLLKKIKSYFIHDLPKNTSLAERIEYMNWLEKNGK